jgi:hypothetical protein
VQTFPDLAEAIAGADEAGSQAMTGGSAESTLLTNGEHRP